MQRTSYLHRLEMLRLLSRSAIRCATTKRLLNSSCMARCRLELRSRSRCRGPWLLGQLPDACRHRLSQQSHVPFPPARSWRFPDFANDVPANQSQPRDCTSSTAAVGPARKTYVGVRARSRALGIPFRLITVTSDVGGLLIAHCDARRGGTWVQSDPRTFFSGYKCR